MREPLIKFTMNHVAYKNEMFARRTTQRAFVFVATHTGTGFEDGLRRQAPSEGNNHSRRHLPCISSRKAKCAVMLDLISGSLATDCKR